jgi:hypothetical protein
MNKKDNLLEKKNNHVEKGHEKVDCEGQMDQNGNYEDHFG